MQLEQPASGYQAFITNQGPCDDDHLRQENDQNNQAVGQTNIQQLDYPAQFDANNLQAFGGGQVNSRGSTSPRRAM